MQWFAVKKFYQTFFIIRINALFVINTEFFRGGEGMQMFQMLTQRKIIYNSEHTGNKFNYPASVGFRLNTSLNV